MAGRFAPLLLLVMCVIVGAQQEKVHEDIAEVYTRTAPVVSLAPFAVPPSDFVQDSAPPRIVRLSARVSNTLAGLQQQQQPSHRADGSGLPFGTTPSGGESVPLTPPPPTAAARKNSPHAGDTYTSAFTATSTPTSDFSRPLPRTTHITQGPGIVKSYATSLLRVPRRIAERSELAQVRVQQQPNNNTTTNNNNNDPSSSILPGAGSPTPPSFPSPPSSSSSSSSADNSTATGGDGASGGGDGSGLGTGGSSTAGGSSSDGGDAGSGEFDPRNVPTTTSQAQDPMNVAVPARRVVLPPPSPSIYGRSLQYAGTAELVQAGLYSPVDVANRCATQIGGRYSRLLIILLQNRAYNLQLACTDIATHWILRDYMRAGMSSLLACLKCPPIDPGSLPPATGPVFRG